MSFLSPASKRQRPVRQAAIRRALARLADHSPDPVDRVLDIVLQATDAEFHAGTRWYATAHDEAVALAARYGVSVRQAAGVIAALSPQTGWNLNLRLADQLLADPATNPGHYVDAYVKAQVIAAGIDPADVLGGRKVRSFFRNIADPTLSGPVTIDRHAIDLVRGERFTTGRGSGIRTPVPSDPKLLDRPGAYQATAAAFRSAARTLGLRPHEVQAIAWLVWRRIHTVVAEF